MTCKRNFVTCLICRKEISKSNFNKHYNSKSCVNNTSKTKSLEYCPYCNEFLPPNVQNANHVRWCYLNPKREEYNKHAKNLNSYQTRESRDSANSKISINHKLGNYKDAPRKAIETKKQRNNLKHSEESKQKIREKALLSKHQRKCKKSHEYTDKKGRTFIFDSSWEDLVANRLDELNIHWDRPEPIEWVDNNGVSHNYFGDFYIKDLDLYIDPKNSYVKEQQKEKIDILSKMISLLIISSGKDCTEFTLKTLIDFVNSNSKSNYQST